MEVSRWSQCYAVFSQMKKNTSAPLLARKSKYSGQSIRAIPIRILTVGKRRSPGVQLLVEEYMEKLRYYCSVEDVHVKSNPKSSSNVKAQIDAEDMVIMQQIRHEDWVVVLDEHGLDVGSVQLADLLGDAGRTGSTRLAFLHWRPIWSWTTVAESCRCNDSIIFNGVESPDCINCVVGATL